MTQPVMLFGGSFPGGLRRGQEKFFHHALERIEVGQSAKRGEGWKNHRQVAAVKKLEGVVGSEPKTMGDFLRCREWNLIAGKGGEKKARVETDGNLRRGLPVGKIR